MKFVPVRVKPHILTGLLFLLIVTIFLCSRLYKIDQIPGSVYWDEASIGYNAYSILKTGSDEWGTFLPVHFKAFGEYKLPVYIYSVAFFESILGLNVVAVRLPAVLFSLGSLIMIFLLSRKIFNDTKLALIVSFIFAISPWFFIFSRTGYEVTAGLFFMLLGIYLFFQYKRHPQFFISSAASFLLAVYSYNSFRLLLPFVGMWLLLILIVNKRIYIRENLIYGLIAGIIFLVGCIPIAGLYLSSDGLERFNEVSIYHAGDSRSEALFTFGKNYLAHFDPFYLFLSGDSNLRSHTGGVGELYWFSLPFLLIGLLFCLRHRKLAHLFVLFLLLIAPIPAALTKESPHALRSLFMIVPLSILTAIGIQAFCKKVRYARSSPPAKNHLLFAVLAIFLFLYSIYLSKYVTDFSVVSSQSWQGEYKQLIDTYGESFVHYDHVVISDRYAQPYVFYLFYRQIDPTFYQKNKILNVEPRIETSLVKSIGNVVFDDVILEKLPTGKLLIFAHPEEELKDVRLIQTIWNPDMSVAFYVYEYVNEN